MKTVSCKVEAASSRFRDAAGCRIYGKGGELFPAYREGFTLIEIMVAIAIIGTSLLILLDAHYNAMSLFADARDEALMQAFLERVLGQAEIDLLAGNLDGAGDFGERYPGYSFSYNAQPVDKEQTVPLYEAVVSVKGPDEERSMNLIVFNMAQ